MLWNHGCRIRVSLYLGVRRYISLYLRTHSRAWALQHHLGTSRVHWSPSAPPLSRRTHPFICLLRCRRRPHGERRPSSVPPPDKCARTPPSAEVLGLLCYHPTARAHKCSNPKIYINLSGTADYGYITHPKSLKRRY